MRNIWTIAKREFDYYLSTPIAYLIAAVTMFILGYLYMLILTYAAEPGSTFVPDAVGFIQWLYFPIFFFTLPALTMRLISAEQKQGTIEILMTAPVRDWEIITGKWLGSVLLVASLLVLTLAYPLMVNNLVDPGIDWGIVFSGYLGLFLVSCATLALGVAISSFFKSQIATFMTTLLSNLIFWFLISFAFSNATTTSKFGNIVMKLDFYSHFQDTFALGVIELGDIIFFVSFSVLWLAIGAASLEMRRWK